MIECFFQFIKYMDQIKINNMTGILSYLNLTFYSWLIDLLSILSFNLSMKYYMFNCLGLKM